MSGPILPTSVQSLCDLFATSQQAYATNFTNDELSRVFNLAIATGGNKENTAMDSCPAETAESGQQLLGNHAIQSFTYSNGSYNWTVSNTSNRT